MKIRIIGGSGSGKTTLGKKISKEFNIPHFDLDDIFWDNHSSTWGKKTIPEERTRLLEEILKNKYWIIEGVYFGAWVKKTFDEADQVIILSPNIFLQHYRIILRWLKRKLGLISSKKKETLKGLIELLLWNHRYNKNEIPSLKTLYQEKSKAEFWDLYNKERQKTGRTIKRGQEILEGDYHLVVHIWIKNNKNEFLIQRRPDHLKWMPGIWATTGGSALAGEESLEAAIRETKEECGVKIDADDFKLAFSQIGKDDITDVWIASLDLPLSKCDIDKNEVAEIRYENSNSILQMSQQGIFVNYGNEYFEKLWNIKKF